MASSIASSKLEFPTHFQDSILDELRQQGNIPRAVGRLVLAYNEPKRVVIFLNPKVFFDQKAFKSDQGFKRKVYETFINLFPGKGHPTDLQLSIAKSYHFDKAAIKAFENLLHRVSQVSEVAVVIFGSWKGDFTAKTMRKQLLDRCSFSRFVIDITSRIFSPLLEKCVKCGRPHNADDKEGIDIDFWMKAHSALKIDQLIYIDHKLHPFVHPVHFVLTESNCSTLSQLDVNWGIFKIEPHLLGEIRFANDLCWKNTDSDEEVYYPRDIVTGRNKTRLEGSREFLMDIDVESHERAFSRVVNSYNKSQKTPLLIQGFTSL